MLRFQILGFQVNMEYFALFSNYQTFIYTMDKVSNNTKPEYFFSSLFVK